MISVGKGDSIIQVLPASLRFWEKLGLTPRAGKKDLTAFLFLEDNEPDKQLLAETWLKRLSATYSVRPLIDLFSIAAESVLRIANWVPTPPEAIPSVPWTAFSPCDWIRFENI